MITVILAAGEGKRMRPLTNHVPKVLLPAPHPFEPTIKTTLLNRLMLQIYNYTHSKIIVVVGYKQDMIVEDINQNGWTKDVVDIIVNEKYATDTNLFSAYLALKHLDTSYVLMEGDILLQTSALSIIYNEQLNKSVLYTCGKFNSFQLGGILKADNEGKAIDIRIVPAYNEMYRGYDKLLGITKINSNDCFKTREFLKEDLEEGLDQYYWTSWFTRLEQLVFWKGDLSSFDTVSFNTPEDYEKALGVFGGRFDGTYRNF